MSLFGWSDEHVNGRLKEEPDRRYPRQKNVAEWNDFRGALDKLIGFWVSRDADRQDFKRDIVQLLETYSSVLQPCGPPLLTPRFAMQCLGTEFGRWMSPDLWVDLCLRKATQAQPEDIVIITDVRFLNEAEAVRNAGGVIWRVLRESVEPKGRGDTHASEEEMLEITPDLILENNGSLELLRESTHTGLANLLGIIAPAYEPGTPLADNIPILPHDRIEETCPLPELGDIKKLFQRDAEQRGITDVTEEDSDES